MTRTFRRTTGLLTLCSFLFVNALVVADADEDAERVKSFTEKMSGVKLIGNFTVVGRPIDKLAPEEYTITKVEKIPEGDKWMFHTRIKYGQHDVSLPLPIDVKWADRTPIITLDELTIPGMGTFGARVVIHQGKYAGTWQHDKVGGHLFGVVEKIKTTETEAAKKPESP